MSLLDYEVVKAEFSEAKQYKLKFQHSESTDLSNQPTTQPVFQNKSFQSSIKHSNTESHNFAISLISISDGKEATVDEVTAHLPLSREFVSHRITFSKANGNSVDGEVTIRYKSTKASLVQALRSEQIYCISIQAAHLNTLVETPFELTLCVKAGTQELSEAVVINNAKPNTHISLNDHIDVLNGSAVQLVITDNTNAHMYRVTVNPASPMVVTIPMKIGDPMVLTLQCMYLNEPKAKMVTGTVHTSFMREASISQTPGSTARKISLSPRRTTSFDQSAAAVGLLGTGQAIASTKKTLLFLEDSTLAGKSTPNSAIIGGIQSAEQINSLGEVVSSRPVENHHEAYLTELSTKILGRDSQGIHVGPSSGAYIVCNSKSEMLTSELGKKTHKKQSLSINLGLMQVAQSGLTGPVRIRAKLVDLVFNAIHEEDETAAGAGPDDADNPESTAVKGPAPEGAERKTRHQQRALIAYIGILEETSRELFNETGLVACTLEGKLFKPTAIQQSATEAMSAAANTIEGVGLADGEEACIAVKLYVSLVPSKTEAVEQEAADSDAESELGGSVEHTDSATDLKKLRKQARGANGELSKQPSVLDYEGLDKEILHSRRPSGDVPSFRADQAFNVVTKETALPGELAGSSVLSVPSSRQTASELLSRVPPLDLHGDHDKPRRAKGAFGENLNAVQVVRGEANKRQLADHETANTGAAFAKLVSAELDKKQQMIESLLEDVKIRSEAIQVCGFDIRALREEQIRLTTKIASMEQEKEQKAAEELKADAATSEILKYPHLMHELDKPALIRNMHKLREKVQALDKDRTALQDALTHAKDLVQQYAALKKEHHNLQEAHIQQTKFLQKMQGKINQVAAFQETIKTQEKIISKMQSIVEAKMRSKNALPFLPKQPIPVPAPQEEKFHPPELPDFEALQAQKVNEEELLQARQEIGELNEKVADLERQLFEAKLDAMNAASGDAGSESEDEGPDLSSLKEEQTDEQKADFENLKGANERIDQLEAESTSKSYRISALEEQLEASTRDYSREIARLRTKLFELEITAAMASDDRGSSAGSDGFMDDMDFDKLMSIQDPSQPARRPSMSHSNSARRGIADSPMGSAAPTPSASQQKIPPLGFDGASSRPSSVATGSARAAVHALKSTAPTTQSSPNKPEAESEVFDGEKLDAAAKALESAERTSDSPAQTPKPSETPSSGPVLSPKASKEQLIEKTESSAVPSRAASVEKNLNTADDKTEDKKPEAVHPAEHHEHAEGLHVPKFRKTSKAGFGPAGPQDPEAVDKVVELAFEIIDSDQVSPRAEATIRTKKDNKIVMAMLNVKVHYHYDHVRKLSTFTIQHIKLHGFSQDLLQDRFEPYLKLSYGDKWKCVTSHAKSAGQTAEWTFNPSDAFFDKMFKVTDDEMAVEANSEFRCVVKKKNVKGHEDFECGDGVIVFTPKLFNPEVSD